jgi:hypothetical protein
MLALAAQNRFIRGLFTVFAAVFAVFAVLLDDALTGRVGAFRGFGHECAPCVLDVSSMFTAGGPQRS